MAHKIMRLMVLYLIPLVSFSQYNKRLNIGDTLPSLSFTHIFNRPGSSISLCDFNDKLIILDFWNRWCHACISAFPKMESLQKKFGDKIQILLVTSDTDESLVKLFKKVKLPKLPIISNDSILNSMFPHVTVPHHIWIKPGGSIQFITDDISTVEENVSRVLDGIDLNLHSKNEVIDFQADSALLKEGNGRLQKYITGYSIGMTKIEENESTIWSMFKDTANKTIGFKFVNTPLIDLYKMAFGYSLVNSEFKYDNRVMFNLPCISKYLCRPTELDDMNNWAENNLVCYESKWNGSSDSLAYQYLQNDVMKFFTFSVKVEVKEVSCYILKTKNKFDSSRFVTNEKVFEYTDKSFILKNMPVSTIIESLNELAIFKNSPVIDETNYSSNINVKLYKLFLQILLN
ncbi:TlpA family protein disulfide reductase [Ferruginibacter sp.]|nr:TlpA family protein disulfide reductase [Ferruginibacter sp.]